MSLTEAGAILLRETESIPNILTGAMRRIQEECLGVREEIRIGVSTELVLAHIPGLFHAHQRAEENAKLVVSQGREVSLLEGVQTNRLDVAILTEPREVSQAVELIHEMDDQFCIITPGERASSPIDEHTPCSRKWAAGQNWLLPAVGTSSRRLVEKWVIDRKWEVVPNMELENFDLMVQLVALGMGSAIVPRRAYSAFPRKHLIEKITMPKVLSRRLVAIVPRLFRPPVHVKKFVEGLLFS